jgi:hypothetical protein
MRQIIDAAVGVVEDDYATELAATVTRIRQELDSHGVERATW